MAREQQRGQLSWNGVSEEVAENEVTEVGGRGGLWWGHCI